MSVALQRLPSNESMFMQYQLPPLDLAQILGQVPCTRLSASAQVSSVGQVPVTHHFDIEAEIPDCNSRVDPVAEANKGNHDLLPGFWTRLTLRFAFRSGKYTRSTLAAI